MGTGVPSREQIGRGVTSASHLHLVPKLRMSRTLRLLPPACLNSVDRSLYFLHISKFHSIFCIITLKSYFINSTLQRGNTHTFYLSTDIMKAIFVHLKLLNNYLSVTDYYRRLVS